MIIFHTLQNILPIVIIGGVLDPLGGFSTALFTILLVVFVTKRYGERSLKKSIEKEQNEIKENE
jgi:hypothetical protein